MANSMVRSLYTSANIKINVTVSFELADFGNLRVTLEYFFKANQTVKSLYTSADIFIYCQGPGPGPGPNMALTWSLHGPTMAWFHSWLKLDQE